VDVLDFTSNWLKQHRSVEPMWMVPILTLDFIRGAGDKRRPKHNHAADKDLLPRKSLNDLALRGPKRIDLSRVPTTLANLFQPLL
jgi:hypothetical protein